MGRKELEGPRFVLAYGEEGYPEGLSVLDNPPPRLYGIGSAAALQPGLAVIGARKATPYGRTCAYHFASLAAQKGVCIISGGARGCDSEAHRAALSKGAPTVVFLGGGCDRYYPASHRDLFQQVIDAGGALVSEYPWDTSPMPYMFRARNRLIAGLSQAVLIVEAGLPSGTFSTADEALNTGKEVLVVPGAITSAYSRGSNQLLYQGAIPIVDDEGFEEVLFNTVGVLCSPPSREPVRESGDPLLEAICAEPLPLERLFCLAEQIYGPADFREKMNETLALAEANGVIERQIDGRWGAVVK